MVVDTAKYGKTGLGFEFGNRTTHRTYSLDAGLNDNATNYFKLDYEADREIMFHLENDGQDIVLSVNSSQRGYTELFNSYNVSQTESSINQWLKHLPLMSFAFISVYHDPTYNDKEDYDYT